jgi:DNA-binding CsgD family transcriptional regulator/tetratricopeptide (TPR) repeat protein
LEAAEAVCSGGGIEREDVLDVLGRLVDKSLVVARASTGSVVRYTMLEPIRQYAKEKLEESREAGEIRSVHAAFFLTLAEEAEPELAGPQQRVWVERLEGEHDNLRESLSWSLEWGQAELALRLGAAVWRFWHVRGYLSEGIRWMEQVLVGSERAAAPVRVMALEGLGWLTQRQGDTERAKATYVEMLKLSRNLADKGNIATALNSLGTLAAGLGENERAKALLKENLAVLRQMEERNAATTLKRYHALNLLGLLAINEEDYTRGAALWEEGLALACEAGDAFRAGVTLCGLGYAAVLQGNYEQATALCEEALKFARELGSAGAEILPEALVNLGLATHGQGDHQCAVASFEEALVMSQKSGQKPTVINTLEGMASLAATLGEATRAAHLWGAAETARTVTGIALPPGDWALHKPYLATARSQLGGAVWERTLAKGRKMSLDRAAEYALSKEDLASSSTTVHERSPIGTMPAILTRREEEVVLLVAQGLTNRQISTELGISERTAGNHVARILRKLGLRSRTQLAGWATEHKQLTPEPD